MYCKNCGQEIDDEAVICPSCGTEQRAPKTKAEENKIFGILGIVFAFLEQMVGLAFSIVGICIYKDPKNRRLAFIGLWLNIAMIVLGLIVSVVIFVVFGPEYFTEMIQKFLMLFN